MFPKLDNITLTKDEVIDVEYANPSDGQFTATVSFSDAAEWADTEKMTPALAVYKNGRLVDMAWAETNLVAGEVTAELTVDADAFTEAKVFVWDGTTLEPYTVEHSIIKNPVAIVKLDDLGGGSRITKFEAVEDWAEENNIRMGFGLITETLDTATESEIARIKAFDENPLIELWCHAYDIDINFAEATEDEATADFENVAVAAEREGISFTAFNPPYNAVSTKMVDLLNKYPNFKAVMMRRAESVLEEYGYLDDANSFTTLWKTIDIEIGVTDAATNSSATVVRNLDDLQADWEKAKTNGYEYVVMQSHPCHGWGVVTDTNGNTYGTEGNTLYDFLLWLKSRGVVFMTPTEYVESL